jgi:predicted TIM-barrel fold metal-dependent hydrolase
MKHILTARKIDSHNHIFDPHQFPYTQGTPYSPKGQEITTYDYFESVLNSYQVDSALIIGPNSAYGEDHNAALLDAIRRSNGRCKGMAVVSSDITDQALIQLKQQGIVGIAHNFAYYGLDHYPDLEHQLERLAALDLIAQVQFTGDQVVALKQTLMTTKCTVVIDHCGRPDVTAGLDSKAFKALLSLANNENIAIKLSGFAKFSKEAYPFNDVKPMVDAIVSAFGEDRILWGSDWPFLMAPYRMDYGTLLSLAEAWFPESEIRDKYLFANAARVFGFEQ